MVASGNLAPNLFMFFIAFLSFYKINKFIEMKGKLSIQDYLLMVVYRWAKYIPVFWFVFFFAWIVLPYISDAPTWYLSQSMYSNCDKYWWSTMLFFNNLYPWFVEALDGCFQWPFVMFIDVQLFFFIPPIVLLYRMNKMVFHIFVAALAIGGAIGLFFIFWNNNLSAGALTLENFYLFSLNFNKPWTKFPSVALGFWMAVFYIRVLEYRSCPSDLEKARGFRIIHFIHNSKLAFVGLSLYSVVALNLTTLVPFPVNKDGYAWNRTQNSIFNMFCQFGYISAVMAILALIFCGWMHVVKTLMSLRIWRPFSKLTLGAYLIYPLVIMQLFVGQNSSIVLSIVNMAYMFFYNLVAAYLAAFVVYMLIQGPIHNIIVLLLISKARKNETKSFFELNPDFKELSKKYFKLDDCEEFN
jgi:hypothetical protein